MMRRLTAALLCVLLCLPSAPAAELQSFTRLKGQEPIRLTGLGLVVGLNGTGDQRFTPMHSAVAQTLKLMGNPVTALADLANVRNAALVMVTCEIAGTGGREGDLFNCVVASTGSSRSLLGGYLLSTPLRGPRNDDPSAYALAEGPVSLDGPEYPNHGKVDRGAKLTADMFTPFVRCEDSITLIVDNSHASFPTSFRVAEAINLSLRTQVAREGGDDVAKAIDAKNVVVRIPEFARTDVVNFVADIMTINIDTERVNTEAKVIINEQAGTVIVTGEVEMLPVLVTHRNLVILPPGAIPAAGVAINDFTMTTEKVPPYTDPPIIRLNDLMVALNRAQVAAVDKIAIIKELARSGKLHAQIIYE